MSRVVVMSSKSQAVVSKWQWPCSCTSFVLLRNNAAKKELMRSDPLPSHFALSSPPPSLPPECLVSTVFPPPLQPPWFLSSTSPRQPFISLKPVKWWVQIAAVAPMSLPLGMADRSRQSPTDFADRSISVHPSALCWHVGGSADGSSRQPTFAHGGGDPATGDPRFPSLPTRLDKVRWRRQSYTPEPDEGINQNQGQ